MKTVINNRTKEIQRVSDEKAEKLVSEMNFSYISKSVWKSFKKNKK